MSINSGFVSIIDDDVIVNRIINDGKNFGKSDYGKGKTVSIEYGTLDFESFIYGDSLSRIMSFNGYDITREYYVWNNNIDVSKIKDDFDKYRVNLDIIANDKYLYSKDVVDISVSLLQKSGKCYIYNDELWLRTTDLYDSEDRLLVDIDGTYSDFMLYLSYHIYRFNCGYDILIDILTKDNSDFIYGIKSGIVFAGYDCNKLEFISMFDNKRVDVKKYDINEVRSYYISNEDDTHINYIEKAYSDICLILREKRNSLNENIGTINSDVAYIILNKISQFENICINACLNRKPSIIYAFLYEIAILFNEYYDDINDNCDGTMLLTMIRTIMNNSANMLGLILIEEI